MLLIVLALVVVVCSFSISSLGDGSSGASAMPAGVPTVTSSRLMTVGRDYSADAPYRRVERAAHPGRVATR